MTTEPTISHLFVYGTLRPGDVRWHLLEPFVIDDGWVDSVDGCVYDTGEGYPAARFDEPSTVHGRTYALLASSLQRCLDVLDREESTVTGLYRRIALRTDAGVDAWAYEYGRGLDLTPIPSGDWLAR